MLFAREIDEPEIAGALDPSGQAMSDASEDTMELKFARRRGRLGRGGRFIIDRYQKLQLV